MKKNDDEGKALEAVIKPLIDAMAPKPIAEPKTKLGQLIRAVIKEQLGGALYASVIDRFLVDGAEKDPKGSLAKLIILHDKIGNVIHEIVEGEGDESVQKA